MVLFAYKIDATKDFTLRKEGEIVKNIRNRNIFSFLLGVILGAIIFGEIITVLAATLLAKDVAYTPEETSWNVDNVEDAINDLYIRAKDYKKLDTTTTATSNNILKGFTAYDSDGNLITGNLSTDCVNGSFVCDSSCSTSSGKQILSYFPTTFVLRLTSGTSQGDLYIYNSSVDSLVQHYSSTLDKVTTDLKWFKVNDKFVINGWGTYINGTKIYYTACR